MPSLAPLIDSSSGRETCLRCRRARKICLCSRLKPFELEPLLALLIHRREYKKSVGTARLAKLSVSNSVSWMGDGADFDENEGLQKMLADPALFPVILFPGPESVNLTQADPTKISEWIPRDRRLAILVIDGSWSLARKMIRSSRSLQALPSVSFDVSSPSNYRFRRQPKPYCLSTVEAIHLLIESLHRAGISPLPAGNAHDAMLQTFDWMVETQIQSQRDQCLRAIASSGANSSTESSSLNSTG